MNPPSSAPPTTPLARSLPPVYGAALLRLLFPLLLLPLMASRLGAEEFGRLGLLLVWAGLLSTLVEGGFLAAATRRAVLLDPAGRWLLAQQVYSARVLLSAAVLALAAGVAVWLLRPAPALDLLLAATLLGIAACALGWQATWYLQATQQLHRWACVEMAVYALWAVAVLALGHSVMAYLGLQALAMAVLAVLGWRWLGRDLRPGPGHGADTVNAAAGMRATVPAAAPATLWARQQLPAGLRLGASMLPVSLAGAAYSQALPAVAAAQMSRSDLGTYFLADRLVRALLAAAEPVFQVVYPRSVARMKGGLRAALAYTTRWALLGALAGLLLLGAGLLAWPMAQPWLTGGVDGIGPQALAPVLATLGLLLPLLLCWKFYGYWMLGSARFDHAYRACVVAGGLAGVAGAWLWGGQGAVALARVAIGVELVVIATAVLGMLLTAKLGRKRATG